jgi:hypothetical protein
MGRLVAAVIGLLLLQTKHMRDPDNCKKISSSYKFNPTIVSLMVFVGLGKSETKISTLKSSPDDPSLRDVMWVTRTTPTAFVP